MKDDEKALYAKELLIDRYNTLKRIPVRHDFTPGEVCFIKQKLGPWPRALEAAGLKDPPEVSAKDKSRLKRERNRKLRKQHNKLKTKAKNEEKNKDE